VLVVNGKAQCNHIKENGERCGNKKKIDNIEGDPDNWYCHQHREDDPKPGGRPLAYKTKEELEAAIQEYFDSCFIKATDDEGRTYDKQIRPFTMTGLAYHLGITRRTLLNYGEDERFFRTITRAKTRIEMYAEEQLFRNQGKTNGVQFNLKNNFGWEDKKKQEIEGEGLVQIVDDIE
jgi:hypothetical protein